MQVKTFYFNPFRECTYLLTLQTGETFVIDCGCYTESERKRLYEYINKENLTITHHLLTHAHLDHVFGARFIYETYGVLPTLSTKDEVLFNKLNEQSNMFGLPLTEEPLEQYIPLEEDSHFVEKVVTPHDSWIAFPTPGHTLGSVCYWFSYGQSGFLFSGDTLFEGGIGRTDLPGGDYHTMLHSLQVLKSIPDDVMIYPGHGYPTSMAREKQHNPYL